jgi:4-hydroxy-3-methylbut-2-enyl diphosphate reductase
VEVKLASSYGFCFGVKRAIEIAENQKNSATLG